MVSRSVKSRQKARSASFVKQNAPKHTTRLIRKILLPFILISSLIYFASIELPTVKFLPIKSVQIEGTYSQVDRRLLQRAIMPFLNGNMLALDISELQKRLTEIPWIANVAIERRWPDKIFINITEYQAAGRWNDGSLLSTTGMIFNPGPQISQQNLPQFMGPEGQQKVILQTYQTMQSALKPLGLSIRQLDLSVRQSWSVQLNNGLSVILGTNNPAERMQRLTVTYSQIVGERAADIDYIDLRYPNGIAVRWKAKEAALSVK